MKSYLLGFVISIVAFIISSFLVPGLNYHGQVTVLLEAAVAFSILNIFVRPVVKILLMPLNFLTMGFLGGVSGLIILWLLSQIIPGFNITDTNFSGYAIGQLVIPSYSLNSLLTTVLGAAVISIISSVLYWLTR